jgi:hypothetical protein
MNKDLIKYKRAYIKRNRILWLRNRLAGGSIGIYWHIRYSGELDKLLNKPKPPTPAWADELLNSMESTTEQPIIAIMPRKALKAFRRYMQPPMVNKFVKQFYQK